MGDENAGTLEKRQTQVRGQLEGLGGEIERAQHEIDRLEKRLQSVLRVDPPKSSIEEKDPTQLTPLAEEIKAMSNRVIIITEQMAGLAERLEL